MATPLIEARGADFRILPHSQHELNATGKARPVCLNIVAAAQQQPPSAERVRGGMLDASDPAGLARFMEKTGYRVELRADTKGDPVITGRI